MVNENQDQEDETKYESFDEVDYTNLLEYSENQLAQILTKCIQCEQGYLSKKTIRVLSLQKDGLEKSNNEFHTRIETLEIKRKELQFKCEDLEKMVLEFSKAQDNLDKLLGSPRMSFNKEGIGYNSFNKKKN